MTETKHEEDIAVAEEVKFKEPTQYNIIVHDNPITSYEEVIFIVSKSFSISEAEALLIARKVDVEGSGVCGTYSREIAESKLVVTAVLKEQLAANMPSRSSAIRELKFTMEPI